jgi:CRISPR system Cascade subunit CasA
VSQNVSFNLVDKPWVRIRDEEGETREVSLTELFEQALHIKCLANDLPTQDFAILRVLLAILQRSISSTLDEDDDPAEVWGDLWNASELPVAEVRDYLSEWHDSFDLFDEQRPFTDSKK